MFEQEYRIVREFPYYFLDCRKFSRYDGADWTDRFTSQTDVKAGNLYEFYLHVLEDVLSSLPALIDINEDWVRGANTRIGKAVREILIDTLVHADYAEAQGIVTETGGNMMFVSNTGTFRIPPKTVEKGGISDPRNPALFRMFGIGLTEHGESGIHRPIFRECGLGKPIICEYSEPLRTIVSFRFRKTTTPVSVPASHATDAMADAVCDMMRNDGSSPRGKCPKGLALA